jgi:AP-3 complex subunit delta
VQSLAQNAIAAPSNTGLPPTSPSQPPACYFLVLVQRILAIRSQSTYGNVANFEQYLSVLARVANAPVGQQTLDQLTGAVGRVKAARRYAVKLTHALLTDDTVLAHESDDGLCRGTLGCCVDMRRVLQAWHSHV